MKPTLEDAISDLSSVKEAGKTIITDDVISDLKKLYTLYDKKGFVTDSEIAQATNANQVAATILQVYSNFLGEKKLNYINVEIKREIARCPMCSINVPETLDHYMPKSRYPIMSVCRLNLVPSCSTCNGRKSTNQYNLFPHAYYSLFPDVEFLKAEVNVDQITHRLSWHFYFESNVLPNDLEDKVRFQWDKVMKHRIDTAAITYLMGFLEGYIPHTNVGVHFYFELEYKKALKTMKKNDWHTALLKAIVDNAAIGYIELSTFKQEHKRNLEDGI